MCVGILLHIYMYIFYRLHRDLNNNNGGTMVILIDVAMEFGYYPEAVSSLPWMGNPPNEEEIDRKEKYIAKNPNGCSVSIHFNVFLVNYTTESLLKEALVSKSLIYKWVR